MQGEQEQCEMTTTALLSLLCLGAAAAPPTPEPPPADPGVSFVAVGMRHGNRNPETFCCGYEKAGLGSEGPMQLTQVSFRRSTQLTLDHGSRLQLGKQQSYYVGDWLRKRYPAIFSDGFNNSQVGPSQSSIPSYNADVEHGGGGDVVVGGADGDVAAGAAGGGLPGHQVPELAPGPPLAAHILRHQ